MSDAPTLASAWRRRDHKMGEAMTQDETAREQEIRKRLEHDMKAYGLSDKVGYPSDIAFLLEQNARLEAKVKELQEHCDKFCKCPSHGASLVHIPKGEFDE